MGDDRKVEIAGLDAVDEVRRRLADDRHFRLRVRAREAGEDLGQVAVGIIVRQAEADAAGQLLLDEGGDAFGVQSNDPPRVVEQPLALVGEARHAAVALEEVLAEAFLKSLHLHRDCRLRLVDDVRGPGERAGVGDGDEGAELVDVEEMHGLPH